MSTPRHLILLTTLTLLLAPAAAPADEIHQVSALGDYDKLKSILERRPELVGARDRRGWQPIHHAAFSGKKDVVELLLQYKADINSRVEERHPAGNLNFTPLHVAARSGRPEVVRFLCEKGADVEAKDAWDQTPLFLASLEAEIEVMKVLVEFKADVNVRNKLGKTPLQRAIEAEKKDVIAFLRSNSAADR
jgi:ankyrin repeat protein